MFPFKVHGMKLPNSAFVPNIESQVWPQIWPTCFSPRLCICL